jgi:RNA polymerase sigma-70 factor (sigma-E family)
MAARDEAGFEEFVAARSGDLLRTAVLLTRDRAHAEDLLQAGLVTAYRRWGHIARDDDPYPAVRRILVATAASRRRVRSTQEIVSLPADDPAGPDPTEDVAERERMTEALATLPARLRTVLVLRYTEGLSEAATAELMGCSVSTVASETARALARLRTALGATAVVTVLEEC